MRQDDDLPPRLRLDNLRDLAVEPAQVRLVRSIVAGHYPAVNQVVIIQAETDSFLMGGVDLRVEGAAEDAEIGGDVEAGLI